MKKMSLPIVKFYPDLMKILMTPLGKFKDQERNHPTKLTFLNEEDIEDPLTIEKALSSPDSIKWKETIQEELDSIIIADI